ncbi:AAA family ATPase [Bradyrhizobium septentrionale]|uniref:AAA family ATPase n=1 Tax=Bradyrhizobium septentrionale TaxID=1404411 RepID=A0A973W3D8_9BRAD|nr:AAA family ATPase [Bradyrhizobium septentrionale]UGY15571.1 AAA family ATPase [Bradyrhizobium septentrionale]UGY24151.1 AAA family ATPase [Bradyrhizobium septentrionale]
MNAPAPITDAQLALRNIARDVAIAPRGERLSALRTSALRLQSIVAEGWIHPAQVTDKIFEVARSHGLAGEPGSDEEVLIGDIAYEVTLPASMRDPEEPPFPDSPDAYGIHSEPAREPAPAVPLALICPPAWRDLPLEEMRWLATNRIPAGDATILSGDGGGGKTTVALQLSIAVERGLGDWLGTTCLSGQVIFFSGEEPEPEMRRRLDRVARKRGLEPSEIAGLHFHFADPDGCLLGLSRPNGPIVPTPLFDRLCTAALEIRPALIVVDSIAAVFGGNQNDRVHARSFVGMFRRLARQADCAVLLLDHPSLSGITSGTGRGGSMDWQNATRARLHLETVSDAEEGIDRILEVKKINYGAPGEKVKLRWEDGCFVPDSAPALTRATGFNTVDRAYLACLDRLTLQGREVREHPGRGYAPKVFADMPEANGITARAFKAAQERLFSAGLIQNVTEGPASKRTKHIARGNTDGADA